MSVLSGNLIRAYSIITPFNPRTEIKRGDRKLSYGVSSAGYDVRVEFDSVGKQTCVNMCPGDFVLASTIEHFTMPPNVIGIVHDKSSWARLGLQVQNTVIEPGWKGFLTLELTFQSSIDAKVLTIMRGDPIAQVVFHEVVGAIIPYDGKYQNQPQGPQSAK